MIKVFQYWQKQKFLDDSLLKELVSYFQSNLDRIQKNLKEKTDFGFDVDDLVEYYELEKNIEKWNKK